MKIIKPDSKDQEPEGNTVFLAGSIDNGAAIDWQKTVEAAFESHDGTIYNPRRNTWFPDLKQDIGEPKFKAQVNWELDRIESSDIVFFYFAPDSKAPITLLELGLTSDVGKLDVIVCCPEGYWRRGNVQIVCDRRGWKVYDDLPDALAVLHKKLTE